ncbi:hypothetical protein ACFV2V_20375 [Streptomyces sp. NPDC059698]|uniref:hypothetical protein n=1 Tax=unclassified Streptomyces TaxID=2593676 RepID=UPI00093A007A|nr:hypothetical protein [Streptomyces sp. CB02366]OKJ38126.1 hypothetical protein AMK24_10620 [Streptomyces sp. CB02366]
MVKDKAGLVQVGEVVGGATGFRGGRQSFGVARACIAWRTERWAGAMPTQPPDGELSAGVTAAQTSKGRQGRTAGPDAASPSAGLATVHVQALGRVTQVRAGQIDHRWGDKHAKFLADGGPWS